MIHLSLLVFAVVIQEQSKILLCNITFKLRAHKIIFFSKYASPEYTGVENDKGYFKHFIHCDVFHGGTVGQILGDDQQYPKQSNGTQDRRRL